MQGDRFLDAGDPRGALEIFQSAVERDDLQADLHLRIAMCQLQADAPQKAKEALRRALFLEPDLWPAAMLLGDLLEAEDTRLAEMYFRQALDAVSAGREPEVELCGALAPFVAGRRAAAEALECRLRLLQGVEPPYRAAGGGL
jgi:Flp pilus assembly protein TadD